MSTLWTFSASSEPYLERCIAAAPPPDQNNKWFQKFGKKDSPLEASIKENSVILENISSEEKDVTKSYEDFFDTIASESTIPVEYVIQECTRNPALIAIITEKLSANTVEQLLKEIFNRKDLENFLTFITTLLPACIKLHYSRFYMDLLVKSSEYPQLFKHLLEILFNDSEIPSQVLNNYIAALNEESVTNFMITLSNIEIKPERFSQNVFVIYTAYKDCIKNDLVQNYIKNMIVQHSKGCEADRNFGRLFLMFLQTEKAMDRSTSTEVLEKCLEIHRSPFKRPCSMLLKDLAKE